MNNNTKIAYRIVSALLYMLSLMPLWMLYIISDCLFYVVFYIVRYRRPLVRKNLSDSFPEKTEEEIRLIERRFYAWFCDYFVETVKMHSMSEAQMKRRMRFVGVEKAKEAVANGQSCAVYLGHYCNWEWVTSLPLWVGDGAVCGQIYHPLENKAFDKLFLELRGHFNAQSIPMADTLREIIRYRQEGRQTIIGFISDQVPFWNNIHYWTNFLNHDTPVLTGTERIARKCGFAAFYLEMHRERRGYYVAEFKQLPCDYSNMPQYALTECYFRALEKTIQKEPQYWLWTHNRWKRTREKWEQRMKEMGKNQ